MLFNSYLFILAFMPLTLAVFFSLARAGRNKLATASLIFASLVFYGYWDVRYLPLLLTSIIFNYYIGAHVEQSRKLLAVGIAVNLLALGYFKYTNFFLDTISRLRISSMSLAKSLISLLPVR